jgi:tRNA (mo5U34)-methyltransferase
MTDGEALLREVEKFPFWYHKIELPHGVVTPGWAPLDPSAYGIPPSLAGRRVLDVGAWDGYWTFESLKRGAAQVVAIDDFSDYLGSLDISDRKAWKTFDFCRDALGYPISSCPRIDMSVYNLSPEKHGIFDTVFFFGTLYHLRYPLLALDKLSSVCSDEIYVESAILDDYSPYRGGLCHGLENNVVMEFYPENQYGNNNSNWWVPTLACMMEMVRAAGFDEVTGWKLSESPSQLSMCRGFVKGKKTKN